ncbi:hypothetical protein AX15_003972 [Amanita polypyramis BW_CC]|nr:hypothetical protein AX15_003972 [Amanita polypyramis BW_CC]
MAISESLTQKWLRQNVQTYLHKDRVFFDIDAALARFGSLRPKTDVYTYDDGRTQLLLCVHGVLPITFRRASYNIPIALWIPQTYPKLPPIIYVVPNNDMLVKPGTYVDVSGRCSPEYIRNWERKSEGCNLIILLEVMQDQYSRDPPLFSKPKERPTPPPTTSTLTHDRPVLPPKPRQSPSHTSPDPKSINHANLLQSTYISSTTTVPPPSPRLASANGPMFQYRDPRRSPALLGHLAPDLSTPSTIANYFIPTNPSHNRNFSVQDPAVSPNITTQTTIAHYATAQADSDHITNQSITTPVANLLDEDTPIVQPVRHAPPRPPNPELLQLQAKLSEKIESEMTSLTRALALDADRLRAIQTDLLAGEPAIRDEMARLEAVRDVCRNVRGRLGNTVDRAEKNVAELRRKGDPEIDEMVCATSIVHNQLINLVAEDNAIEDTIYQLHRALNAGRIDLERFLRTTRVLAEEQFMKRALLEKITIEAALSQSTGIGWS